MALPVFVVEHLDEEFFEWSQIEYRRIADEVYPCELLVTNFSLELPQNWCSPKNMTFMATSIADLGLDFKKICLMDSEATEILSPDDSSKYTHILLGGILGNVDEFDFDRTSLLRKLGFPGRHLGNMQMSTDTAAICAKKIVVDRIPFSTINFIDRPEIDITESEKIIMNFRYIMGEDGLPSMAPEVLNLIKNVDFDFDLME